MLSVRGPQHPRTECLRRLHGDETIARDRLHHGVVAHTLDGIDDRQRGHGRVGTSCDRADDRGEQLARCERARRVMDHDDVRVIGNACETRSHGVGAGHAADCRAYALGRIPIRVRR